MATEADTPTSIELPVENATIVQEEFQDVEDSQAEEVVVIFCILQTSAKIPGGKNIWRRIAVPADFTLLELHVCLQNAFQWENTHLHNFLQPKSAVPVEFRPYSGIGRTKLTDFPLLDVDSLDQTDVRSYLSLVGVKEASELLLTAAEDAPEPSVYVQHSHPHEASKDGEKKLPFDSPPQQLLEERSFLVRDVLKPTSPALVYEYDYGMCHQVTLLFQGIFEATEGINYPACLAGQGASMAEDGNDVDIDGNLLPSYDYDDFSVLQVLENFLDTYEDSWPVGPASESTASKLRCYMCRYNRECGRRSKCSGSCCDYCLKSAVVAKSGKLSIGEADDLYNTALVKVVENRNEWVMQGTCSWVEEDGEPCALCPTAD